MKHSLLAYLVCPECSEDLVINVAHGYEDEIEAGQLTCHSCDTHFPIVRGIPRFVGGVRPLSGQNLETAAAFGWEWQHFDELHDFDMYRAQYLDWIDPIEPEFLRDKVVLDAGCGMGRFSIVSSEFGAKEVLAIDASDAVESARQNARDFPNVHVIQASIHQLPLRRGAVSQLDFIFSIGVLHHLDDPQAGFNDLVRHMRPGSTLFAWVYGRENNGWLVNFVNPVRSVFTSRLPRQALYALSWLITLLLHPLVRFVYRPAKQSSNLRWLDRILPYSDYLSWLGQFGFHHNHHVVFDHLVAPVAFYLRGPEFKRWFKEAGLELIDFSWRNKNSWRGHGRK